jgi:hypothetical protein
LKIIGKVILEMIDFQVMNRVTVFIGTGMNRVTVFIGTGQTGGTTAVRPATATGGGDRFW